MKIISGGQNGVDLAGLHTGKYFGFATGGMMPKGFRTLDGPKPEYKELYGMKEHSSSNYPPRTYCNVKNSDGTLRLFTYINSPGELCTLKAIKQYNKTYFDIDLNKDISIKDVVAWIETNNIETLNIAGNSEKTSPGIFEKAAITLYKIFKEIKLPPSEFYG